MKTYIAAFFLLFAGVSFGQSEKNKTSLIDMKTGFYQWLESAEAVEYPDDHIENEMDGLETRFMRWYWLMQTRTLPDGTLPDPGIAAREWSHYRETHPMDHSSRAAGWEAVGTAEVPTNGGGAGRVNVIRLHPDDPDVLFIGTAGGGVWKSPDAGETWIPLSDNIPVTSIADIAINPIDPDIIYIATGDGYGYEATWQSDNDFWGGVYSCGVMKSADGGLTWEPTGLSYLQEDLEIVQRLIMHPNETNILLAATRNGIYRTTDDGVTWTLVDSKHCHDLAINTGDPDIYYAVGDRDVLISEDKGETWDYLYDNLGVSGDRMSIETSEADPDLIYVLSGSWATNFYKSTNGGTSWSLATSPSSKTSFYGYYDNAFTVSDLDGDVIFAGGLEVVRTINGASSWQKKSNWSAWGAADYVHADNHAFATHPTDVNIVYSGNDGGVFRSDDQGETWYDLSEGLRIAQIYRLGTSATDPERVLSGWQDNGTNLWDGTGWEEVDVSTWDGMEALIDYTDPDIMFLCHQYGGLYRTTNGGTTWNYMSASGGAWVTPYVMDPNDHEVLYYGGAGYLYRSTNGGNTWAYKSAGLLTSVTAIAVAPSNSDVVYASSLNVIRRSDNMGDTWSTITGDLPVGDIGINYIAVSNLDENVLWVGLSGYDDGNKVFYSADGGTTWENVSGTLPNVPVNTIVFENDSENRVYVGTDIGVFYTDDYFDDWLPYMTGLPNVMIHELEINYTSQKLVAATYGRGIWQSDLAEAPQIDTYLSEDHYCVDEDMTVDYAGTISFWPDNELTAELSDATGSFDAPLVIGTALSAEATGSIAANIPADLPFGTAYRIRVNSSSPAITGFDNGSDLTIGCGVPGGLTTTALTESSVTLNWDPVDCALSYDIRYRETGGSWIGTTSSVPSKDITGLSPLTDYEWSVQAVCLTDPSEVTSGYSDDVLFSTPDVANSITASTLPFELQVTPNPLGSDPVASFTLAVGTDITVILADRLGQEVMRLHDGFLAGGAHQFSWSTSGLASGVYTLLLTTDQERATVDLILE